jgi:ABC-2 type transport system ATP-binding protein
MAAVYVRDLSKRYGAVQAVDGISFEVGAGEVFGLLGRNGAGKTTTLECVMGLRTPDAGHIEVCGVDARAHPTDARRRMGAALQTTELQDKITPREALSLFASLYGATPRTRELLDTFALTDKADAPFASLSGGQRQRLALALALVNSPQLVVLDEPTAGLDPVSRRDLHTSIDGLRAAGTTVLLTTHAIDEAERLCDRVAIIDKGRIAASGRPAELIARSRAAQSVTLVTSRPVAHASLAGVPVAGDVILEGVHVRFTTNDATRAVAVLAELLARDGVELVELHVMKASLEDLFVELTQ